MNINNNEKFKFKKNNKLLEYIVLFLFVAGYIFISCFHEPWFDEGQAWQIAKCCSLKELLFVVTHYEGHPPLWYLILAIPAKAGVPYEIGLKAIGGIITFISVFIIIFKSPFPRLVRLLLPFNYFIFYQYGVIVRPYCLMLLAFLFLAVNFKYKDQHPVRYCILLTFLCLTSAYGILMAGGIAACWALDILKEKGFRNFFTSIFKDRRITSLLGLLITALLIVSQIIPYSDTYVTTANPTNSLWMRLLYALLIMPGESVLYTSPWFLSEGEVLQYAVFEMYPFIGYCLIGLLLWFVMFLTSDKNHFKYLLLPQIIFGIFAAMKYFGGHHVGLPLFLLVFWFWILVDDGVFGDNWNRFLPLLHASDRDKKILIIIASYLLICCLIIPVYWNVKSSAMDFLNDYSAGRAVADFLKENNLDEECSIMCGWGTDDYESLADASYKDIDTNYLGGISVYLAYFDHNIFENAYKGADNRAFYQYRLLSDEENKENMDYWRSLPYPDVLVGSADVDTLYDGDISLNDNYTLVFTEVSGYIWKGKIEPGLSGVYMRNDLVEKYGFEAIDTTNKGIEINDYLRKQYEEGQINIDDIVDAGMSLYLNK